MWFLVFAHVFFGLIGILSGLISVAGLFLQKRLNLCNTIFLATTWLACLTGFVFLPMDGVTSAQLVGFFLSFLLMVAAYARYRRRLEREWIRVYAFSVVGALFLNVLIATAQSFQHVPMLQSLAPTQESPVYLVVKFSLLIVFVVIAVVVAGRVDEKEKLS